jgi:LysM repeat protein
LDNDHSSQKLPPRSEYHKEKRKKTKFRIKYPIIRLLALFFILLPVSIWGMTSYIENQEHVKTMFSNHTQRNYEEINYAEKEMTKNITVSTPDPEKESVIIEDEAKAELESSISDKQETEESGKTTTEKNKGNYELKYHTVKANENLYRISMKYYHSRSGEEILKQWNKLTSAEIYEGQVLVIPIKITNTK